MNKKLANIKDLKSAFISHCKELGCDENYIKACENKFNDIETAFKNQQRQLDLICEVLVDVSKANYANLNVAISDIREVLDDYE